MITAKELAIKVSLMRKAQSIYFRTKSYIKLDEAKRLESEVDRMVKEVLSYNAPVTGNLFNQNNQS